MKRNLLTGAAGAAFGILLLYAGGWVTYKTLMSEDYSGAEWKGDLIRLFIVRELIMLPVIAAAVGIFIGGNVRGRAWWVALLSLLPTIFVFNGGSFLHGGEVLLTIIYLFITVTASIVTWHIRNCKRVISKVHV